jgi:GT2 family glycosyltransferase
VRYPLPVNPPLVSIIVPTRDAPALLRQCVESVLAKTTYPSFELIVVDNQSADPEALAYLAELAPRSAVRVLRYDRPFNYSAINNFAVRQAKGDMLCLLNNDTEVISLDWLEEMAGHLLQDKVGAVGARLLYTDGRVQHGGVTVGPGGCADHLHAELPRGHPGYCHRAVIAQELSAVTAACVLTWKDLYERMGGLNERALPVAFNDVDYCLRLQDAGYRVIYTPHAELYHHEWGTRGVDTTWRQRWRAHREMSYMRSRWRERMKHDPYYNPNLSYDQPNFTLNWKPRVKKPWER